jgi:hypothetical protein
MQAFSQFPVSDEEFAGKKSVAAFVVFCLKISVIFVLQVAATENKNGRRFWSRRFLQQQL